MDANTINQKIKDAIINNEAVSFGKLGNVEAFHLYTAMKGQLNVNQQLFVNAGVYVRSEKDYIDWCQDVLLSVQSLDFILEWCPNKEDKLIIDHYCKGINKFHTFEGLEPFVLGNKGWHNFLSDKTVLCVSPFSETVKSQSQKFNKIWNGATIGNVVTVTCPYSEALTGQEPKPWQEKLSYMLEEINKLDFDFATVGCGGLSLSVCKHIKQMGKPCVHLGGGNQLLYGIRGRRWDDGFAKHDWYGTDNWVRPLSEETPVGIHLVEGGCYW